MMLAAVYGRLGRDPKTIDTAKSPMCVSSIAVELVDKNGDATAQWFALVAFGRAADVLAKHSKGELIACSGRVQMNSWTGKDGQVKTELQLVADSIVSARAARPGGKRRNSDVPAEPAGADSNKADFDDDIPF